MAEPQELTQPYESWTPVQVERKLAELFNSIAQAEMKLRDLTEHELDAKMEYEKAHLRASTDPMCPKVERGGYTVAERDDWIRGVENDEYEAYEMAKLNVKMMLRYADRLDRQVSIVQTMSKHVLAAYGAAGTYRESA